MQATQATIDQWTSTQTDPFTFEEYGPTADRPLPPAETGRPWKRQLRAAGFCPDSLAEEAGIASRHMAYGYHPDDEHRDRAPDCDREALAAAEEAR